MFEIKQPERKSQELFITHPDKPLHVMRLTGVTELVELHAAISEYLTAHRVGEFIGSAQAQEIARAEGYEIPITSLVNACARDTILGAYKKRGRWLFPKANFESWFGEWKAKQPARDAQGE